MAELKPCPFCGSKAKHDLSDFGSAMVFCTAEELGVDCPANSPETGFHDSLDSAVTAWNTRAAERSLDAKAEAFDGLVEVAQSLVDAMETCHECKGTVLVEEQPTHCEDCSAYCEEHEGAECPTIYSLHLSLKQFLARAREIKGAK